MFPQIFVSPPMKQSVIISTKQGAYEFPRELSINLQLRLLGNKEKSGKSRNFLEW